MKKTILLIILVFISNVSFSQKKEELSKKSDENNFYYFEIPSSLNGSNLDPSPISNVTSNFSTSKISVKLGFPSVFREPKKSADLKNSGFLKASFTASNGIATLYKSDNPPLEFGISGGYSRVLRHKYWVFVENNKATKKHSSESMSWLNILGSVEQGNYNLFSPENDFDNLKEVITETNSTFYLSLNNYFHSEMSDKKIMNHIASVGIGYAKTNNYNSLKKRTFEEGKLIFDSDSTNYQTITETKSGRIGEFKTFEGLSTFAELFIPIIKSKKYGGIYFGNRISFFGIGNSDNISNGVTGLYFNLKDRKVKDKESAKDILNFSITGQFLDLGNAKSENYIDENFSILLQASIPLRFN